MKAAELVIQEINQCLSNTKLRLYFRSLFIDTRLKMNSIRTPDRREPRDFDKAVEVAKKHHAIWGSVIRGLYPDLRDLGDTIDDCDDDIERLAIWAEHLDLYQG